MLKIQCWPFQLLHWFINMLFYIYNTSSTDFFFSHWAQAFFQNLVSNLRIFDLIFLVIINFLKMIFSCPLSLLIIIPKCLYFTSSNATKNDLIKTGLDLVIDQQYNPSSKEVVVFKQIQFYSTNSSGIYLFLDFSNQFFIPIVYPYLDQYGLQNACKKNFLKNCKVEKTMFLVSLFQIGIVGKIRPVKMYFLMWKNNVQMIIIKHPTKKKLKNKKLSSKRVFTFRKTNLQKGEKKIVGKYYYLITFCLINHNFMTDINYKKWELVQPEKAQQIQEGPYKKIKEQPEGNFSQEQQIEPNESKWEERQKQIETYLQCVLDSDYLLHISQILKIYNIDIKTTQIKGKIKEFSRVQYIEQQKIQNIFHFSSLKQFFRSFSQHTRKVHENITLLVEKFYINNQRSQEVNKQKLRITILSSDNKILHIYSNVAQSLQKFLKFVQNRFRRLKKIFCVEVGIKKKEAKLNIIQALQTICESVVYAGILCFQAQSSTISKKVTSEYGVNLGGLTLAIAEYDSFIFISQKIISQDQQNKLIEKINRLVKIQDLLMNSFTKKSPLSTRLFYENQYCCCLFAFYFNLIKNYDQMQITQQAALSIQNQGIGQIIKSLQKFDTLKKKQKNNCKKCFPKLMDVSKKCWVCKKSKPKYICQGCSQDFEVGIYLCVDRCFKEFHKNKDKYISKVEDHNKIRKMEAIEQEELDKNILRIPQSQPQKTKEQYEMESKILRQQITSSRQQIMKNSQKTIEKFLLNFQKNPTNSLYLKSNYLLNSFKLIKKVQIKQSQFESESMQIQESESQISVKKQEIFENDSIVE